MKNFPPRALALFTAITLVTVAAKSQIIDTASAWIANGKVGGTGPFGEFGMGPYDAYGQTFITPAGYNALTSFSWSLQSATVFGTDNVTFAAYVAKWDTAGLKISGGNLFTSTPRVLPPADQQWTTFTFSTGTPLKLDPHQPYVIYLSARPFFNGINGAANVAANAYDLGGDVYLGGNGYLGADFFQLSTAPWIRPANEAAGYGQTDFAITARFSAVPEPSTYTVIAAGALCLTALLRHRSLSVGSKSTV